MSCEKTHDVLGIRFTRKNYAWEFQFKVSLKWKELWGHIDGPSAVGQWQAKDAQIVSWIY